MSTKILIAYFSHWGHTRQFTELIADLTGGDLFEITTDHHYPVGRPRSLFRTGPPGTVGRLSAPPD